MRYLRNRNDGFIYEWNEILAENVLCEEVTEEQAYPERFEPKSAKGRKAKVDLSTDGISEPPQDDLFADLNAELTRTTKA